MFTAAQPRNPRKSSLQPPTSPLPPLPRTGSPSQSQAESAYMALEEVAVNASVMAEVSAMSRAMQESRIDRTRAPAPHAPMSRRESDESFFAGAPKSRKTSLVPSIDGPPPTSVSTRHRPSPPPSPRPGNNSPRLPGIPGSPSTSFEVPGKPFVCVLELIDAFPFKQRSASAHSSKTASTSPTTAIKAAREARGAACLHMSAGDLAQINKRPSDDKLASSCFVHVR